MSILKCKMCSEEIPICEEKDYAVCEHCGSTMTIPKWTEQQQISLYNRATHFRQRGEFDRAASVYEKILEENKSAAEAYWGLFLCRFGIEYRKDPKTLKRVPICHRPQSQTALKDENYLAACENATGYAKTLYMREAVQVDQIRRTILEAAGKEKPFDVYVCCKERDENGCRTRDSVLAQEMVHELTRRNLRVFSVHNTLEQKLPGGQQPAMYAALHSARVLLVIGTRPEHFQDVWIKNEWQRFLDLRKQGHNKLLIPVFQNMDVFDLPEEFLDFQALDLGKNGAKQELIRGVEDVLTQRKERQTAAGKLPEKTAASSLGDQLQQAFQLLEQGSFDDAKSCFYSVLNYSPRESRAYWGLLLCETRCETEEKLVQNPDFLLESNRNFQRAVQFAREEERPAYLQAEEKVVRQLQAVCEQFELELLKLKGRKKSLREQAEGLTKNTVSSHRESRRLQQELFDSYASSMKNIEVERQEELKALKEQLRKKTQEYAKLPLLSFRSREQVEQELEALQRGLEETEERFRQQKRECRLRSYGSTEKQIREMLDQQTQQKVLALESELKSIQQKIALLEINGEYCRSREILKSGGKYTPIEGLMLTDEG